MHVHLRRLAARASATTIPCLLLAACGAPPKAVEDTGAAISAAAAVQAGDPIAFRLQAPPLDEPAISGTDTLTVAQAVERALRTDPGLQAALARVRMAEAEAHQAGLLPNPILSVVVWFPTPGGSPEAEVFLAIDLIRALQTPSREGAAKARLLASSSEAVTAALDLAATVGETYAAAQASDVLIPLLEGRRELLDRLLKLARSRLDAGEGTRSDITTLEAERVTLEVEIAEAALTRRDARLRLSRLVGEPSGSAGWPLEPFRAPPEIVAPEGAWVETALTRRPEVAAITYELAALGYDLRQTRLLPFEGGNIGPSTNYGGNAWGPGPSINTPLPIFDWGQAKKELVQAQQIEAVHRLSLQQRQIVEEVRRAHESLRATRENLARVRNELIPLQERRRTEAEAAFRNGQTDVTPLFLAEQQLRETQARRVELEQRTTESLIRLQRAAGGAGVAVGLGQAPTVPAAPDAPSPSAGPTARAGAPAP